MKKDDKYYKAINKLALMLKSRDNPIHQQSMKYLKKK